MDYKITGDFKQLSIIVYFDKMFPWFQGQITNITKGLRFLLETTLFFKDKNPFFENIQIMSVYICKMW